MSLGIFSFDLGAIIRSLSSYIDGTTQQTLPPPAELKTTLDKIEDVLEKTSDTKMDEALAATAIDNAVTSLITSDKDKKEIVSPKETQPSVPLPPARITFDEATRKEIERLIKSLQTSVAHNYRSSDIIDEDVSLRRVANVPVRNQREEENSVEKDRAAQDRKRDQQKLEQLRDELKKAMLKNNSEV